MTTPPTGADIAQDRPLVIEVGGTARSWGGVQMFCQRAAEALETHGGWRVIRLNADTAYMSVVRLPSLLRGFVRLIGVRNAGALCVWIQYGNMLDLTYVVLARALGFRVIVTPHLGDQWRSRRSPVLRGISNALLRGAHRLALISPTQDIELHPPRSIPQSLISVFLPQALLEEPVPETNAASNRLQLLHGGRLSAEKGTFLFVDMCAALRRRGVDFDASITGGADSAIIAELTRRIEAEGLSDRVRYLGMLPADEMVEALRRADVLVHLSRQDSYPAVVLEAMACGAFPVCFDLAGARHMIETYDGLVVGEGDIATEVSDWLADQPLDALRARAARLSSRIREDFAWRRCAEQLAQALSAVSKAKAG